MSLFSSFFEDYLTVSQGSEWVVRVLVVLTDPFQDRAKHRMFGHPARNTFGLVTSNCRCLYLGTNCDVVTRYGPVSKVARNMRITVKTVKITRVSHREINKCSVNSG